MSNVFIVLADAMQPKAQVDLFCIQQGDYAKIIVNINQEHGFLAVTRFNEARITLCSKLAQKMNALVQVDFNRNATLSITLPVNLKKSLPEF